MGLSRNSARNWTSSCGRRSSGTSQSPPSRRCYSASGWAIAGVPAIVFLTVATFVLTLLPLVGAFGIWIPAAVYLVVVGRPTAGVAMVIYGLLVTFSDSYLRPALIGRTSAFNSAIVVGIFGGLVVFGAVGLFIGFVVLGGAKLTLDCFARGHTEESIA